MIDLYKQISLNISPVDLCVRFTVGLHVAIGLLLMWLDPLASLFGEQAGQIIGLRVTHPLLPCLGLFWMLVAAALVSQRRFVIKAAMSAHGAALLLPLAGILPFCTESNR